MSFLLKIGLVVLLLSIFIFHKCNDGVAVTTMEEAPTTIEPVAINSPEDEIEFNECSGITRQLLIKHCGSCHQSSLPTQKAGAIAVFDLDKNELWHDDLSEPHLQSIGQRLLGKSDISEEEKEAISLFLELKEGKLNITVD